MFQFASNLHANLASSRDLILFSHTLLTESHACMMCTAHASLELPSMACPTSTLSKCCVACMLPADLLAGQANESAWHVISAGQMLSMPQLGQYCWLRLLVTTATTTGTGFGRWACLVQAAGSIAPFSLMHWQDSMLSHISLLVHLSFHCTVCRLLKPWITARPSSCPKALC